ncbi:MAG: glycine cleavage T C-terminal barrel domain-containing protein [Alphaproteobacteria bacterium]
MTQTSRTATRTTPPCGPRQEIGARMVPFAGYLMPLHDTPGILAERRHTRAKASLFDVSHMGQVALEGEKVGSVTSGGFGPTVGGPVAMGYVAAEHAADGTAHRVVIGEAPRPTRVAPLPFVPTRHHKD